MQSKSPPAAVSSRHGPTPQAVVVLVLAATGVAEVLTHRATVETFLMLRGYLHAGRLGRRHRRRGAHPATGPGPAPSLAVFARVTWHWMTRNLQLAHPDLHRTRQGPAPACSHSCRSLRAEGHGQDAAGYIPRRSREGGRAHRGPLALHPRDRLPAEAGPGPGPRSPGGPVDPSHDRGRHPGRQSGPGSSLPGAG